MRPPYSPIRRRFTFNDLARRANRYARWALDNNLGKGDVVCLLMPNRPEYFAIWLGITCTGAVVSLLNTNLVGPSLAHCMRIVSPRHVIASTEFISMLHDVIPHLDAEPKIWLHGPQDGAFHPLQEAIGSYSDEPLAKHERRNPAVNDLALYIYTSGTTGMPKAAKVSHGRTMQWSHWFSGMMDVHPGDRMYNCLPMYHSVGGVQVMGALLAGGGSVVVRDKFSARQFWSDVVRWDCTLVEYIGELCRYLLHTEPSVADTAHRVRLACGNGMAPEIWDAFKERFNIPQILEFYAATEANISLFNVQGKRGSIGHIPPYLAHRFAPALVAIDVETGAPLRNAEGFCIRCAADQPGEALGKIHLDPSNVGIRFDGYTSRAASMDKILHNVFEPGDAWFRTGDLMRRDEKGYFYFVDRLGDTFRRKGENVATLEVAEAIATFPGIQHVNVYGVAIPGVEGRVGMASIQSDHSIDLAALRAHLVQALPHYARPVFLRMRTHADLTGTFKYSKTQLVREGYDPALCGEPLYFEMGEQYVPLDEPLYKQIQQGEFRI